MKVLVYFWVRSNMPDESTKKLMRSVHFWVRSYLSNTTSKMPRKCWDQFIFGWDRTYQTQVLIWEEIDEIVPFLGEIYHKLKILLSSKWAKRVLIYNLIIRIQTSLTPRQVATDCLSGSWAYVPGKPMHTSTKEFRPQSLEELLSEDIWWWHTQYAQSRSPFSRTKAPQLILSCCDPPFRCHGLYGYSN